MTEPDKNVKDLRTYRSLRSIKSLKIKKSTRINRTHVIMDVYKCDDKALAKASLETRVIQEEEWKVAGWHRAGVPPSDHEAWLHLRARNLSNG